MKKELTMAAMFLLDQTKYGIYVENPANIILVLSDNICTFRFRGDF
jgi:hypothetical protein